jgi:hypothetical protein
MARERLEGTVFENGCLDAHKARSAVRRTVGDMVEVVVLGMRALGLGFSCLYLWKGIWGFIAARMWRRRYADREEKGEWRVGKWPWVLKRDGVWRWRWRVVCAVAWCVALGLGMIVCLVSFALKREMTAEVAGPSLEESKWGFGQVMALTTWLPTVVDFLLILKGECSPLLCRLIFRCVLLANCYLAGNLKAVEYRLPLGVEVRIPGEGEKLLSDDRGDDDSDR